MIGARSRAFSQQHKAMLDFVGGHTGTRAQFFKTILVKVEVKKGIELATYCKLTRTDHVLSVLLAGASEIAVQ